MKRPYFNEILPKKGGISMKRYTSFFLLVYLTNYTEGCGAAGLLSASVIPLLVSISHCGIR